MLTSIWPRRILCTFFEEWSFSALPGWIIAADVVWVTAGFVASGAFVSSCHHESKSPTLNTRALIFHPHLPRCGPIHASSLHISLSLFSAAGSHHIIVTGHNGGWRTSLLRDTSHCSVIISGNRRLIYVKALWLFFQEEHCGKKNRHLPAKLVTAS